MAGYFGEGWLSGMMELITLVLGRPVEMSFWFSSLEQHCNRWKSTIWSVVLNGMGIKALNEKSHSQNFLRISMNNFSFSFRSKTQLSVQAKLQCQISWLKRHPECPKCHSSFMQDVMMPCVACCNALQTKYSIVSCCCTAMLQFFLVSFSFLPSLFCSMLSFGKRTCQNLGGGKWEWHCGVCGSTGMDWMFYWYNGDPYSKATIWWQAGYKKLGNKTCYCRWYIIWNCTIWSGIQEEEEELALDSFLIIHLHQIITYLLKIRSLCWILSPTPFYQGFQCWRTLTVFWNGHSLAIANSSSCFHWMEICWKREKANSIEMGWFQTNEGWIPFHGSCWVMISNITCMKSLWTSIQCKIRKKGGVTLATAKENTSDLVEYFLSKRDSGLIHWEEEEEERKINISNHPVSKQAVMAMNSKRTWSTHFQWSNALLGFLWIFHCWLYSWHSKISDHSNACFQLPPYQSHRTRIEWLLQDLKWWEEINVTRIFLAAKSFSCIKQRGWLKRSEINRRLLLNSASLFLVASQIGILANQPINYVLEKGRNGEWSYSLLSFSPPIWLSWISLVTFALWNSRNRSDSSSKQALFPLLFLLFHPPSIDFRPLQSSSLFCWKCKWEGFGSEEYSGNIDFFSSFQTLQQQQLNSCSMWLVWW